VQIYGSGLPYKCVGLPGAVHALYNTVNVEIPLSSNIVHRMCTASGQPNTWYVSMCVCVCFDDCSMILWFCNCGVYKNKAPEKEKSQLPLHRKMWTFGYPSAFSSASEAAICPSGKLCSIELALTQCEGTLRPVSSCH
jgi:hypothetical protein